MDTQRAVVIGGGISGLVAAHRLDELTRARGLAVQITLLEATDRFGGVIETASRDGLLLEGGPDAFISEKPWALDLCRRLGLADEIIETQPECRRSFIVRRGKLVPVPEGFYLVAPSSLRTVFRLPLLSWPGRLRMACEPFIPARMTESDESVGSFIRRRVGREALDRIGQPMIAGIYTADPDRLSLQATMPRLSEMERRHGSLIRALRANARATNGETAKASGPRYSLFLSLRHGMQSLVERLIQAMPEVSLRRSAAVARIEPGAPGVSWTVTLRDGARLDAEALCLALPANRAAALLASCAPDLAQAFASIPYESVATVNLAFRSTEIPRPPSGFGFVVPACEHRRLIGCTFASVKFPGRAPEGSVIIRAFIGGALHREVLALDDGAITRMVCEELRDLVGIQTAPHTVSVHRHPEAMPQYHVGHLARVDAIEAMASRVPGFYLTGNGFRGLGVPDCIHQAEVIVERMVTALSRFAK